ncbi:MAG: ATP-binding protein [Spirochaetes bacterium]|nr:ATP-binding protein [Spirochaetota bacterium]
MYYNRNVALKSIEYLKTDEILIFTGARQTGKTTILKHILDLLNRKNHKTLFINLEDMDYLGLLNESPKNLLRLTGPLPENQFYYILIDEIQYLENPTNFLKFLYDEYHGRLKIIVSGSSAFYIDKKFRDSLAGRKKIFNVYPLSFSEFLLFKQKEQLRRKYRKNVTINNFSTSAFLLPEIKEISSLMDEYIRFGGYPGAVLADSYENKKEFIQEIANSYIKKDILESRISYTDKYYRLFKLFSAQIGKLVNKHELANTLNLSVTAVDNYLYLMQKSFHVSFIKPFYKNMRKEITKMQKVYFFDLGLRNYFYRNFDTFEIRQDRGELYENFVYKELLEKSDNSDIRFWRNQNKNEVDFIIDEQLAYEIKYNISTFSEKKYKLFLSQYPRIKLNVIYHSGTPGRTTQEIDYFKF